MSLFREQAAFLLDVANLVLWATERGWMISGRELGRTAEQQAIHVKAGRSKTMNSNHLRNCAIDLYFMRNGQLVMDRTQLAEIGAKWESMSPKNSWGGNWNSFKDVPHFERRP